MNVYSYVVFDVDGTLLDTEYSIIRSLQRLVFQMHGTKIAEEDLQFSLGITGADALKRLDIPDTEENFVIWNQFAAEEEHTIRIFEGIEDTLKSLKEKGVHLGVITSRSREEYEKGVISRGLGEYFEIAVCCDDTKKHKPNPEPMLYYLEKAKADSDQVLYIGDSIYDMKCAKAAGVKGALALWGCKSKEHIQADYYLEKPQETLELAAGKAEDGISRREQLTGEPWLSWAKELQFIGQAGITYSRDHFDRERFGRIREIASEIMSKGTGLSVEKIQDLFCNETGFQTPKLDTRAVIIKEDRILLVQEKTGLWSLPGGWVDVNQSIESNTEKEVLEEAGLHVKAFRILAVHDRNKHNPPPYPYGVCKVFVQCSVLDGSFAPNSETISSGYFKAEELPPLAEDRNTKEQIQLCMKAAKKPYWEPEFD